MKRESFLKGTIILILANTISKILGAVLKIPLTYILGEEGMAIYQTAFSVYIMLISLVTAGVPFALSKYISEESALKKYGNIRFSTQFSMVLMCILGLLCSLLMYFGSNFFALSMKDPMAQPAIRAISPAIFFVAVGAVYKSCYQGRSRQIPTATSQVIEAFIKLLVGYFLASYFSVFSVKYASAAAIFGVTVGELLATLILLLLYTPYRKEIKNFYPEDRKSKILKTIASVAVPMSVTSVISSSLGLLETSVIRNRLTHIVFSPSSAHTFLLQYAPFTNIFNDILKTNSLSLDGARWLYGAYSGYAATVFNLPVGIFASFGVCILPIVASLTALGRNNRLKTVISSASKIIFAVSVPVSIAIYIFSAEILDILFSNTAASVMLKTLAPILPVIALDQFVCSALYSRGEIIKPFWYSLFAHILKIGLSFVLIAIPEINILGVIISTASASLLQLLLCSALTKKVMGVYPLSLSTFFKTTLSGGIFFVLIKLLYMPVLSVFRNTILTIFIAVFVAFLGYVMVLYLFNVIKKDEILHLVKC